MKLLFIEVEVSFLGEIDFATELGQTHLINQCIYSYAAITVC